ncbi:hypothetical protein ACN42_g3214 [Penicillium freii]|uniref:Uncharacterized protein n=1 Tax=Penicillium freii TaxID=48697 RepID=A0A101MNN0_PENFR|nr:hypothetical protein ACN42_g3214 [Penicillium freii]
MISKPRNGFSIYLTSSSLAECSAMCSGNILRTLYVTFTVRICGEKNKTCMLITRNGVNLQIVNSYPIPLF